MQTFPAPAKLNLFLHVVGRRPDGYHLLQSVMRLIDYGDVLGFEVRHDGQVYRENPLVGVAPADDLCARAARLLQSTTACKLGVSIRLDKKLPMGGGLGGGSSDAATTLLALNRLWRLDMDQTRLLNLALQLGADVPFFVFGESAFVEGIGEVLTPISLEPAWYVVLVPPVEVPTGRIFASKDLTRNTNPIKMTDFSMARTVNALETVVCRDFPQVDAHLSWLRSFGNGRMSGSGGCVFGTYPSQSQALEVMAKLPDSMRGFVARGLDQHPLRGFAGEERTSMV
ncbi:MAG: 4-(cytidine 5'-diphospho)-2-C-methyl-D-erythritol kinase [Burkholderiales bacterium]